MVDVPAFVEQVRSGVIHIEYFSNGNRVASGSGFMSAGALITNHHVYLGPPNCQVSLAWQLNSDPASRHNITMSYGDFQACLVSGSDESNFDFAILDVPKLKESAPYQFTMETPDSARIGDPIALLGFPLEHRNLVCHSGIISSFYKGGKVNVIQLDASVNQSNSGGPLIDLKSGHVIGIVTRKGTGLSRLFDQLFNVFDQNIAALERAKGIMGLGGLDPVQALMAGQVQMKQLAEEIRRSANVGIGYAFSAEYVLRDLGLK